MPTTMTIMVCTLASVTFVGWQGRTASDDSRTVLAGVESSREALFTGSIEWTVRARQPQPWGVLRNYSSRFGGDDYVIEDRGDADGTLLRAEDGSAAPEIGTKPFRWLLHKNMQWRLREGSVIGEVLGSHEDVIDVRCLGLNGGLPRGVVLHDVVWFFARQSDATVERRPDGTVMVQVSLGDEWLWTCLVDPDKGYNPVRVDLEKDGVLHWRTVNTLECFNGTWFPKRAEIFVASVDGGKTPAFTIDVTSAVFNRSDQPTSYGPADIGIVRGMNVDFYENNQYVLAGRSRRMGWDGERLLSRAEFSKGLRDGTIVREPNLRRAIRAHAARGKSLEAICADWERYTALFIQKYNLSNEQTLRARAVLAECVSRANDYFSRKEAEYSKLRKDVAQALDEKEHGGELDRLVSEMTLLQRPLDEIYASELRPRLSRIPTRAQVTAADGQPRQGAP